MEKRKKRFWSLMISILMVLGLLWAVPKNNITEAAAEDDNGVVCFSGGIDSQLTSTGLIYDRNSNPLQTTEIKKLIVDIDNMILNVAKTIGNSSMVIENNTDLWLMVNDICTVECASFSGNVLNDGTFTISQFDATSLTGTFKNNGVVKADKVILQNNGKLINSNSAKYEVEDSFESKEFNSEIIGNIVAKPQTTIKSDGGGFTLTVNGVNRDIVGSVDEIEAWKLMDPVTLSFGSLTLAPVDKEELKTVGSDTYVKTGFRITPPSGYAIGFDLDNIDRNYLTINKTKFESLTSDSQLYVVRLSDYKYTKVNYGEAGINIDNIHFDDTDPTVTVTFKADGTTIDTPSEGDVIEARSLSVTIKAVDDNLLEIIKGQDSVETPITASGSTLTTTLDYSADPEATEPADCYYQVFDKAGNDVSLGFKLKFKKSKPTATLSVPDVEVGKVTDTYMRNKSTVTTTNSEASEDHYIFSYKIKGAADSTYNTDPTKVITKAGDYTAKVEVKETTNYNSCYATANFKATRQTPELTVKVDPTEYKVGDSIIVDPYLPSDWDGSDSDIIMEYKATSADDASYKEGYPTIPGTYMLRVTIPETDIYESATVVSNSFTIKKGDVSDAKLTMSDIEVGSKFEPSLAKDSLYDGDITYQCKLASKSAYDSSDTIKKGDKIMVAGKYTAIALLAETASYNSAKSNEVTFTVTKKKVELGVSVADVIVGDGIYPKITPTDIPLDVEIKEEYKGIDEDDSAYTNMKPTKAGKYMVRETITGSKIYEDATAVTTFTIGKKKPANYSVSVADIIYGGTIEPVVTTDSDGKELAKFEYKKKGEDDSSYSSVVPTDSGDYSIRATIPETDNYLMVQCENTFSIGKIDENTATVSVPDTVIGTEYEPVLSTASDGKSLAVYKYKLKDADDSAYSTTKPTAAGEYVIYVVVPETSNYKEQTCTSTFTISKKKPQIAEVSIADKFNLGDEIKPEANISPYTGPNSPVFEYKLQSAEDSAYTSEVPTEAGKYSVRAYVAESDEWEKIITKSADFIIGELKTPTAAVEIPDVYVGTKYEPLLTTDSDGKDKAVFEYKSADDEKAEFSKDKPTKAGKYIVRATVPATDRYKEAVCEGAFTISKINVEGSKVKVKDTYVGSEYTPVLTTDSDGKDKAVFEFKLASADDSEYTKDKPVKAGEYSIRAIVPETDKYLKVVCESTFKIKKKKSESYVILSDQHVGIKYKSVLTTDSDGKDKAVYEYKAKGEDDDAYTKDKPTKAGEYVLRVTIPETDEYEKIICETSFSITYLKDANISYKVSGTNGKNGYYTTDVYIAAPDGYEISTSRDGKYSDRIKYTEDITKVYMRRKSDGAQMEVMTISEIKIDKDAPQLINAVDDKNNPVDLSKTEELYADRLTLSFNDENLSTVKVNGEDIATDGNNVAIVLDAEGGDKYFAIIVEDLAGNRYSSNIVLKSAWMKDNTIPPGAKVKLSPGKGYKLSGGSWTVSGDSTVYNGDRLFYVNSAGDYVFVQQ